MTAGAARRFTITGLVSSSPSGGSLVATASILRPADVTDPDATNPDAAPPTNAQAECDSPPSGVGCNNVKVSTVSFAAAPNAGVDQTVIQGATVTLTANTPGTWSAASGNPSVAVINNSTSISTTVTGLTNIGRYNFVFTNANGCTAAVAVNVLSSAISISTVFTPNGDGKNDTFEITGITNYPGSQLLIFNRWGNEVYRSGSYANTWDGSGLAEGTYYYLLNRRNLDGSVTAFKGFIYLKR
ncbi:gliding motility-associated C-terminal domain-containing protein [Mucilaginibacter ginkgonis]|uniref:Gliding motility-associated C-terminal domain-containing protein n=2 Tax=Mucilaginibacter ginkgonis TaxID=2682091 RepID=A0A7T7FDW3_9SPHI|nr:gliding motility-associated C-terminal domain-containing protein [Mucilaginibacter ginkgonis]